jgi:2-dehydropantoate 2-reductase
VTTDVLLASPAKETEIRQLMAEIIAAANHLGLGLSQELIDLHINRTRPMGAYRTSSMIDFVEGREVEISPIWCEPLRRATAAGFAMPHLADLLQRIEARQAQR